MRSGLDNILKLEVNFLDEELTMAWTGPEGSRRSRLPDIRTIGTGRW